MGAWGIRERQSDYGLDLLGTIVGTQLKAVDFAIFNTAEAIELLRQDIMEDIKRTNRGCPPERLDCYINANFPPRFAQQKAIRWPKALAGCKNSKPMVPAFTTAAGMPHWQVPRRMQGGAADRLFSAFPCGSFRPAQ